MGLDRRPIHQKYISPYRPKTTRGVLGVFSGHRTMPQWKIVHSSPLPLFQAPGGTNNGLQALRHHGYEFPKDDQTKNNRQILRIFAGAPASQTQLPASYHQNIYRRW